MNKYIITSLLIGFFAVGYFTNNMFTHNKYILFHGIIDSGGLVYGKEDEIIKLNTQTGEAWYLGYVFVPEVKTTKPITQKWIQIRQ